MFCPRCGARLGERSALRPWNVDETTPSAQLPQRTAGHWIAVVLASAILALLVFGGLFLYTFVHYFCLPSPNVFSDEPPSGCESQAAASERFFRDVVLPATTVTLVAAIFLFDRLLRARVRRRSRRRGD